MKKRRRRKEVPGLPVPEVQEVKKRRRRKEEPVQEPEPKKKRRRKNNKVQVQQIQQPKKRRRVNNNGTPEEKISRITAPWGGFIPYVPDECPSPRFVIDSKDKIKWTDTQLCAKYCPKDKCKMYVAYRNYLAQQRKK